VNQIDPNDRQQRARPVRHVRGTDDRHADDVYTLFAAPEGETRTVQVVRPFSVLSKNTYSAAILPPLGLGYLAAVLRKAGYPVGIIDAQGEDIFNIRLSECGRYNLQGLDADQLVARIPRDCAVIGVSLMFSQEWLPQRDFIKKARARFPNAVVVAGGEHPTALPEYVLRDCPEIDYVVSGEGEFAFLELAHHVFHGTPPGGTPGISYIDAADAFVTTGLTGRINHIDELPRPTWDLCPVENYFQPNWAMGIGMGRHMPVLATRGCPYQCTFCSNPHMWTTRYKMRDPVDVADEIAFLVREYDANSIDFFDLTAIVKKDWTLDFCNELKRRGLDITWQLPSGTRSEALDEETLTALYETGCSLITYAPESGSEQVLKDIKKKLKLPNIIESIRMAKRIGHTVKINLVIGFPDDTLKSVLETVWFSVKMAAFGADDCNIAVFSPYPGSELYNRLLAEGKLPPPNDDYIISLLTYFDFTKTASYCERVSGRTLTFYRLLTLVLFYSTAYLLHPRRIARALKSLRSDRFQPGNVLEQRLYDVVMRIRRRNQTAGSATS